MTLKIMCLHGMSQNAEVFRTRLGRLPHKAKAVASFHFENAPHLLPLKTGDEAPMRTWYVRDPTSGSIDGPSLQASLRHLDEMWATHGPFDGVLGFSMGGSMAVILAHLSDRFPGLRCIVVGGARDLPATLLDELGVSTDSSVTLPSLHLMGAADKVVPAESSRQLAARFSNPVVMEHEQGHCIPSRAVMLDSYVKFLKDVVDTPVTIFKHLDIPQQAAPSVQKKQDSASRNEDNENVVCATDEVASLQSEEMEALCSIFCEEITLLRELPSAAGDPTALFEVKLTYSGEPSEMPCARWASRVFLRISLPSMYPEQGLPLVQVRVDNLDLHEFKNVHRTSLLRAVRPSAGQSGAEGGMLLLDCIQAGNDWLSGGQWSVNGPLLGEQSEGCVEEQEQQMEVDDVDPEQEQRWIQAATDDACKAAATLKDASDVLASSGVSKKEKGDEGAEQHSTGVWGYTVGLVGKPSAGKSTFYNAVTRAMLDSRGGRKVAEVAAHPFTTIEPNVGPGWYLSGGEDINLPDPASAITRSSAYGRVHGRRLLPVVVKDVAGLVPGAYQGRGRGNKFLGDLCDADVLVHVVDCTGQADRDGNKVVLGGGAESSGRGSSPAEDAAWIREELHRWIFGNVRAKWESVVRRGEGVKGWQRVVSLFSGYQGFDPRHIVQKAAQRADLNLDKAANFSEYDIHRLVAHYLSVRFPTCLALNKIDELHLNGEKIVQQCQEMALARGEVAVPVSARAECRVLMQQLEGCASGTESTNAKVEESVLQQTLSRWGSTGILEAISAAVELSPPVLCYPVSDLESEAPVGWSAVRSSPSVAQNGRQLSSAMGGEQIPNPTSDVKEGAGVETAEHTLVPRLQDCLQLKPFSTVYDVFEALKKNALSHVQLHGDFVRADGKGLSTSAEAGMGRRKQLRRDQVIDEQSCVLRIFTNKKHTWQKDYT